MNTETGMTPTSDALADHFTLTPKQREAAGNWLAGWVSEHNEQALRQANDFGRKCYPTPTSCAWCDHERGVIAPPGTSHTICERHAAQEVERAMEVLRKEAA